MASRSVRPFSEGRGIDRGFVVGFLRVAAGPPAASGCSSGCRPAGPGRAPLADHARIVVVGDWGTGEGLATSRRRPDARGDRGRRGPRGPRRAPRRHLLRRDTPPKPAPGSSTTGPSPPASAPVVVPQRQPRHVLRRRGPDAGHPHRPAVRRAAHHARRGHQRVPADEPSLVIDRRGHQLEVPLARPPRRRGPPEPAPEPLDHPPRPGPHRSSGRCCSAITSRSPTTTTASVRRATSWTGRGPCATPGGSPGGSGVTSTS